MKTHRYILTLIASCLLATAAHATDRKVMMPIDAAMAANDAKERLGSTVKFYFADQTTPAIAQKLASDKTSQKTNAFAKSDEKACNWVFLSAMLRLKERAVSLGADAVVNIVSNYNNVENPSATEFECHVGGIMAGVALKGDFVKLKD